MLGQADVSSFCATTSHGVIAYSVSQRTREIGVRVALGADATSLGRLVVGGGMKLTTMGILRVGPMEALRAV